MKIFRLLFAVVFIFSGVNLYGQTSVFTAKNNGRTIVNVGSQKTDVFWYYPEKHLIAEQYERLELAVDLPESIEKKVNHFLETDDTINGINPFLEWQLDITANFTHELTKFEREIDAFYYNNFSRDTSDADFRKWDWIKEETAHPFRVRFAPPKGGKWNCIITVTSKDTSFQLKPFQFEIQRTNEPGYVSLGPSRKYFTLGGETYFPSGQNLVSPRCEFCYKNSNGDLPDEGKDAYAAQSLESWMLEPTAMKGFLMFQNHMKSLAANGGDYFRELLMPQNQDIEWEKLGNYYGRQNRAWELDEQFFLAESLGLKIQLNVQIQFALVTNHKRVFWNWSRDPQDKKHISEDHPCANPYNLQIETTKNDDPNTFYSDPTAKKFYKQKLRYLISRWGYSTSWAVVGMSSEMQNPCTDAETCVSWMEEMGNYLKKDLQMDQLLSPSFLGIYHDPENYEYKILEQDVYDMSTLNWYSASPTKYQGLARTINRFVEQFNKPFFFGEIGNSDLYPCDTARIEWIRDAWMTAFSGNAGVGMNWDEPFDNELRKQLGNIRKLTGGIDFDNNGTPWQTRRVISDNRKVESMYLINPEHTAAVGVLSNRYYNWYMYGDTTEEGCSNRVPIDPGFDGSKPSAEKGVWERTYKEQPENYIDKARGSSLMNEPVQFSPFEAIDYNNGFFYRIRFKDFEPGYYTIEFYNALTMELLDERTNWGPNIRLEYPEMNENSGLIAFKIYKNSLKQFPEITKEERIPIDYTTAEVKTEKSSYYTKNNRYEFEINRRYKSITFNLLDEPAEQNFEIVLIDQQKNEEVYRAGFETLTFTTNIQGLKKSVYRVEITINGITYIEEFQLR